MNHLHLLGLWFLINRWIHVLKQCVERLHQVSVHLGYDVDKTHNDIGEHPDEWLELGVLQVKSHLGLQVVVGRVLHDHSDGAKETGDSEQRLHLEAGGHFDQHLGL